MDPGRSRRSIRDRAPRGNGRDGWSLPRERSPHRCLAAIKIVKLLADAVDATERLVREGRALAGSGPRTSRGTSRAGRRRRGSVPRDGVDRRRDARQAAITIALQSDAITVTLRIADALGHALESLHRDVNRRTSSFATATSGTPFSSTSASRVRVATMMLRARISWNAGIHVARASTWSRSPDRLPIFALGCLLFVFDGTTTFRRQSCRGAREGVARHDHRVSTLATGIHPDLDMFGGAPLVERASHRRTARPSSALLSIRDSTMTKSPRRSARSDHSNGTTTGEPRLGHTTAADATLPGNRRRRWDHRHSDVAATARSARFSQRNVVFAVQSSGGAIDQAANGAARGAPRSRARAARDHRRTNGDGRGRSSAVQDSCTKGPIFDDAPRWWGTRAKRERRAGSASTTRRRVCWMRASSLGPHRLAWSGLEEIPARASSRKLTSCVPKIAIKARDAQGLLAESAAESDLPLAWRW